MSQSKQSKPPLTLLDTIIFYAVFGPVTLALIALYAKVFWL